MFNGFLTRTLFLAGVVGIFISITSPTVFAAGKSGGPFRFQSTSAKLAQKQAETSKSSSEITVRLPESRTLVSYDARMLEAAEFAQKSARSHSIRRCWRFVKRALVAAELVESYPQTAYAKQAASELSNDFGFTRIPVTDPFKAPVGSVLVYGGSGAGHVEIRTPNGFVSDFASSTPSPRPLIGVYVKPGREG